MTGIGPLEMIVIICILAFFVLVAIVILATLLLRPRAAGGGSMPPDEDSLKAGDAASGDLAGAYPSPQVAGLRGQPLSPTPPEDGQVLVWNQAAGQWEPRHLPDTSSQQD